ncbi:MAG: PKD domain-containing protein [Bacteroidetes bacterium]|nr:PKD domain-containing protein [Bacteroidota bacterium]MBL6943829.1 PKD domain-containing protein [Bacteroidales bacterium]
MKKILFSFLVIAISAYSLLAQVNRAIVLVEIATGTGCQYCPGSAMGLDDLYTNGDPVAGIEYHSYNSGDPFNTPEAAARNSYYGVTGYPTAQFDGEWAQYVGGSNTQTMYPSYLPLVTARMAIQSEFTVEIYGDNTGNNYNITVRVNKVSTYSGSNLKVRFALTETDIPYNWYGMTTIDYTERIMVPDENGTAVSFTSGNEVDVNLSFVFNSTWVDSNCELIAWIQDDANKYVLHSESVMLLNLQPDVATANFSASTNTVCEGGSVQFTDLSGGAITSWDWTFEGGTPPTSTDQNPSVIYNTQGNYDVTLEVSDGTTTSTLLNENMIDAIVEPIQPDTPVGEIDACNSGTYLYTTQPVPFTDTYVWEVIPADAGTFSGSGTEITFEADGSWTGAYTVSVRADNSCGIGTWSAPLNCTLNYTPLVFELSDGGGICEGSPGLELTQDGSETGIDYDVYLDGVYTGNSVSGTGNPLSFGFQTDPGIYTVFGSAAVCETLMMGTPWIYYIETPAQPSPPDGSSEVCNNSTSNYTVSLVDYADTIYWALSPIDAGLVIGGYFEADIEWDQNFVGLAYLSAQGANECGVGPVSDEIEITVSQTPNPVVSGLALVCNDEQADYSVEENAGSTYVWEVVGGDIVGGSGTSEISVMWGVPGVGSVLVTETSVDNCDGLSDLFEVTIDDCIGINESIINKNVLLYPNPASTNIEIEFNEKAGQSYKIVVYNSIGKVMTETSGITFGKMQNVKIDVSKYQSGIYIVNLMTESGLNISNTFEKTK